VFTAQEKEETYGKHLVCLPKKGEAKPDHFKRRSKRGSFAAVNVRPVEGKEPGRGIKKK